MERLTEVCPTWEIPGGKVYTLEQYFLVLECECGERMICAETSSFRCRCGADHRESAGELINPRPNSRMWHENYAAWLDGGVTLYPRYKDWLE